MAAALSDAAATSLDILQNRAIVSAESIRCVSITDGGKTVNSNVQAFQLLVSVAVAFGPLVGIYISIVLIEYLERAAISFTHAMRRISIRGVVNAIRKILAEERPPRQLPEFVFRRN